MGGAHYRQGQQEVAFVAAAVSLDDEGQLLPAKLTPVPGFTPQAMTAQANAHLSPDTAVVSDGLTCFAGVTAAVESSNGSRPGCWKRGWAACTGHRRQPSSGISGRLAGQ